MLYGCAKGDKRTGTPNRRIEDLSLQRRRKTLRLLRFLPWRDEGATGEQSLIATLRPEGLLIVGCEDEAL